MTGPTLAAILAAALASLGGFRLAATLAVTFVAGFYLALVVRAWIADRADRRIDAAARETLSPHALDHLREYLAEIDEHEKQRVGVGKTTVYYP